MRKVENASDGSTSKVTTYQKPMELSVGARSCSRGNLPLWAFLYSRQNLRSNSTGSAFQLVFWKRKCLTCINLLFCLCRTSLLWIDVLLLPIYTTSPLASPNSYMPARLGADFIDNFVNGHHLLRCIGIPHLVRKTIRLDKCNVNHKLIANQKPAILLLRKSREIENEICGVPS